MGARPHHTNAYRKLCGLLIEQRHNADLTQRALALRLKKPRSFVSKTELGERRIDPVEFLRWCRACGIDPADALREFESRL